MDVVYEEEVPGLPHHKLQVGASTWQNGVEQSVRFWVPQANDPRHFDRYNSPEMPARFLPRLMELAMQYPLASDTETRALALLEEFTNRFGWISEHDDFKAKVRDLLDEVALTTNV